MSSIQAWEGAETDKAILAPDLEAVVKLCTVKDGLVYLTRSGRMYLARGRNTEHTGSLREVRVEPGVDVGDFAAYGKGKEWLYLVGRDGRLYRMGLDEIAEAQEEANVSSEVMLGNVEQFQDAVEPGLSELPDDGSQDALGAVSPREIPVQEATEFCSHGYEEPGAAVKMKLVSAGDDHVLYLAQTGEIWVEGSGPQLGLFSQKETGTVLRPVKLRFFQGRQAVQVACGANFSLAVVRGLDGNGGQDEDTGGSEAGTPLLSCPSCQMERTAVFEDVATANGRCPLGLPLSTEIKPDTEDTKCHRPESSSSDGDSRQSEYKTDASDTSSTDTDATPKRIVLEPEPEVAEEAEPGTPVRKRSGIFGNTEAARQFITRQLSWITNGSGSEPVAAADSNLTSYIADSTREILKENVSHVANMVYEGVRTVGDKVGILSRHFSSEKSSVESFKVVEEAKTMTYQLSLDLTSEKKLIRTGSCNLPAVQERNACGSFPSLTQVGVCGNGRGGGGGSGGNRAGGGVGGYGGHLSDRPSLSADLHQVRLDELVKSGRALIDTEVWSWGCSSFGQLGVGDMLERPQPNMIHTLSRCSVCKVCAGRHQGLALTLDGQVYSWGRNQNHHPSPKGLSTPVPNQSTPKKVQLPNGDRGRDIAAGDTFGLVLCDSGRILYLGKREVEELSPGPVAGETPVRIMASGFASACVFQPSRPALEELTQAERRFLECGIRTMAVLRPFLPDAIEPQRRLIETFERVIAVAACSLKSLTQVLTEGRDIISIVPVRYVEEYALLLRDYNASFCDAMVAGVLTLPRGGPDASKVASLAIELSGGRDGGDAFQALMTEPIKHMSVYKDRLQALVEGGGPRAEERVKRCKARWAAVWETSRAKRKEAEITWAFWESCPAKVVDAFRTPERRLLRESRSHPITVAHSGRFSSHWIILLCDVLIHSGYSTHVSYPLQTVWVESVQLTDDMQHLLTLTMPEDVLVLSCPTTTDKVEWVQAFQSAIKKTLGMSGEAASYQITPPLVRNASFTFTKAAGLKDATYTGQWLCGKMHGQGELVWPDGKRYCGQFKQNLPNGYGIQEVPPAPGDSSAIGPTVYEGSWRDGRMCGAGVVRYPNGSVYEGYLKDGAPHGHGIFKQGQFVASAASVYIGEWEGGMKQGYGVMDDILAGEKYMGIWQNDMKHGSGMIVTLDGVYYEGTFAQNKMAGLGLMIFEDGTYYEGEFGAVGIFNGKGTLTFSNQDKIEGSFYGSWNEGIKMNGTFWKNVFVGSSTTSAEDRSHPVLLGKLCVPADRKWEAIFKEFQESLDIAPPNQRKSTQRIWENLAVATNKLRLLSTKHHNRHRQLQERMLPSPGRRIESSAEVLDGLERIPQYGRESGKDLTLEEYRSIRDYLEKAFDSGCHHPLGQLMKDLVNVYTATYGGVRVHPHLLTHAVAELRSLTSRLYNILRVLFTALPLEGHDLLLLPQGKEEEEDGEMVTPSSFLHPFLMPRVHSSLFMLYALHNKKEDDAYWERLLKWNKQPDIALFSFLGVDQKFWSLDQAQSISSLKDQHFFEAVEMLQLLKTTFTPMEKLQVIRSTFQEISKTVEKLLGDSYRLTMDDLFPLFLYIVVRSRILQLGSEIQMIEDFMEPYLLHGELDIMFTTLKACYWQILRENLNILT